MTRPGHRICREDIDPDVLKIIFRLHRLGFTAYVTGGAVRDLLLGRPAKDFDIVTNARPGQIKKRFHNAYIIGRRFRLVHVKFWGGKVIEVATFRSTTDETKPTPPEGQEAHAHPYGTPAEDAFRRDISINALYYDVIRDAVIDYVGGLEDMERRIVRVIGDPAARFTEDPVRMWRVLRHASRLGFTVNEAAEQAIASLAPLVAACPVSRLYEEFNKDLANETRPVIEALRRHGLLRHILGKAGEAYETDDNLFGRLCGLLDIKKQVSVSGILLSPEETYGLFFWPWLEPRLKETRFDLHKALTDEFTNAGIQVHISKGLRSDVIKMLIHVAAMIRASRAGGLRWSPKRKPQYEKAFRLFFLIDHGRPPRKDESFDTLFGRPFDAAGRPRRRRRRRPWGAPPPQTQTGPGEKQEP